MQNNSGTATEKGEGGSWNFENSPNILIVVYSVPIRQLLLLGPSEITGMMSTPLAQNSALWTKRRNPGPRRLAG